MSGSGTLSELSKLFTLLEVGQDKDLNSSECDYKLHISITPVCLLPKAYKNDVRNLWLLNIFIPQPLHCVV